MPSAACRTLRRRRCPQTMCVSRQRGSRPFPGTGDTGRLLRILVTTALAGDLPSRSWRPLVAFARNCRHVQIAEDPAAWLYLSVTGVVSTDAYQLY